MRFRSSIRFLPFKHYNKFVWPGKTEKDVIHLIHKKIALRPMGNVYV